MLQTPTKFVLIDTWWNVNFIRKSSNYKNGNVLIDTWWNVNPGGGCFLERGGKVLIDTWWNVNRH